jgi:hypothetical protein
MYVLVFPCPSIVVELTTQQNECGFDLETGFIVVDFLLCEDEDTDLGGFLLRNVE